MALRRAAEREQHAAKEEEAAAEALAKAEALIAARQEAKALAVAATAAAEEKVVAVAAHADMVRGEHAVAAAGERRRPARGRHGRATLVSAAAEGVACRAERCPCLPRHSLCHTTSPARVSFSTADGGQGA